MPQQTHSINAELSTHWLISAALLLVLVVYNIVCHVWAVEIQINIDEEQRVLIRSILYGIAIILFPLVKLLRHILLRLNQTMPGDTSPGERYLTTLLVCQLLIETVSVFGLLMFILGDGFNTLYIFSALGCLGLFLHKPNPTEYQAICLALSQNHAQFR